ncbi:hypothetical protein H632_c4925p0 [Helicosporidium sp. ATCC 50920]|nr:hypothetical protein H632_c4925p0 [Helicosporidium sp. ATCC 50920]|eukprot:KDD71491.1 hypothetical protein H632_c4925p0 [Helicosporidium sp. ATCC 50920]
MLEHAVRLGYFVRARPGGEEFDGEPRGEGALPGEARAFSNALPDNPTVHLRSVPGDVSLLSVYVTCVYLALKVADRVWHAGQLSAMLESALGITVLMPEVLKLEMECLEGLQWRLGPYFAEA